MTTTRGPRRALTPLWCALVQRTLDDLGKSQRWLAERIEATEGAVSQMLAGTVKLSALVDATCELLELPRPEVRDLRQQRLHDQLDQLRDQAPTDFDRVAELVDRLLKVSALDSKKDGASDDE